MARSNADLAHEIEELIKKYNNLNILVLFLIKYNLTT